MTKAINLDWNAIHTVFLDMDGTLLDLHFDNHFWLEHVPLRYAEKQKMPLKEAKKEIARVTKEKEGTLDWYCLRYWSKRLDLDIVALKHEISDRIAIRSNVEHFLQFLKNHTAKVVLLTNADRDSVNIKFSYVPIASYFDQIISSHDFNMAKEEAGFWDKLAEQEDFDPEHSLFIDDNLEVLREAKAHGIKYLLAIKHPDSQQAPKDTQEFVGIECFSQIVQSSNE